MSIDPIPAEYMSDHLILLVGTNPLPNYVAARLLLCPGGHIYLLATAKVMGIADRLRQLLLETGATVDILEIGAGEPGRVFQVVTEYVRRMAGSGAVGLNYTGGTKAMAVHSYRAVEQVLPEATFSYLNANNLAMVFIRAGSSATVPVANSIRVSLELLLKLHGYEYLTSGGQPIYPSDTPVGAGTARRLVGFLSPNAAQASYPLLKQRLEAWEQWLPALQSQIAALQASAAQNGAASLEGVTLPAEIDRFDAREIWDGCEHIGELAARWSTPQHPVAAEYVIRWLNGLWLENYTLEAIQQVKSQAGIAECWLGIKPMRREKQQAVDFEFDVAAMKGYQLFAFSCGTGSQKNKLKLKLFEAYQRAAQMGGEEARTALVCCALPYHRRDNKSNGPGIIQQEIQEDWDAQNRVRVFGLEHLLELPRHLEEWFINQVS